MSIRYKTLIMIGSIFIILLIVLLVVVRMVMLNSFFSLEKTNTLLDTQRGLSALDSVLSNMHDTLGDWAPWDETYAFIQTRNPKYIKSNLTDEAVAGLQFNFMVFVDPKGKLVFAKFIDLKTKKEMPTPLVLLTKILTTPLLTQFSNTGRHQSGILMGPIGPVFVCSQPILKSDFSGPIMGILIAGRYLDEKTIQGLSEITQLQLSIFTVDQTKDISIWHKLLMQEYETKKTTRFEVLDAKQATGYALLRDIDGLPALVLRVDVERLIYQEGLKAVKYYMFSLLAIGLGFIVVIMAALERVVLRPLGRLRAQVDRIGRAGRPEQRVPVYSRDELGDLAGQINQMLEQLQKNGLELAETNVRLNRDIQERIETEKALRESEQRFRELAELLPEAIFEMTPEGKVTFGNQKAHEYFGYTPEEIKRGVNALDVISPEDRPRVQETIGRILAGEQSGLNEYRVVRKDGSSFPALFHSVLMIHNERPVGIRGFSVDITEKKRIEAQLKQSQRLESIGTLAGGVAHDFNNILMGVQGCASLMLAETEPVHPHFEYLKNIENYVRSAANLTRQLLGFARGGKYQVKSTDLNDLVQRTAGMFGRTKKEIVIHARYQKGLWPVEVDQGQVEQVLLNLFVNAGQAMPAGGDLYLETQNTILDENRVLPYQLQPGSFVKVMVTDTGMGIDEKVLDRIFDPFFTTKEMGRGTGLGLASAYGIIKSHGGIIHVVSEKGMGSTFTFYLPASGKEIVKLETGDEKILTGSERVLLVDDEPVILNVGRRMLERLGYKVSTAASGKEALQIYREAKGRIDLVVLDMVMPELSGEQTYKLLKEHDPQVKVLLSTGYSIHGQAAELLASGCNGFIQKPFNLQEFSKKLREILDAK
ncbi:MAG: PAS domain S-box protein [Desulfobacteraceae bacterium]|nr:MAG: PAS domain S-box protein [Desulfobacteraceae bacterium]